MGHQIILQPDGKFCVWSSVVDDLILYDGTSEEIENYYAEQAEQKAREEIRHILVSVIAGNTRQIYHQFAKSWDDVKHKYVAMMPTQPCPCGAEGCTNATNDLCWEHMRHEPDEGAYRVCGECFHVFYSAEELLQAENLERSHQVLVTDPDQIFSCPLCAHDF